MFGLDEPIVEFLKSIGLKEPTKEPSVDHTSIICLSLCIFLHLNISFRLTGNIGFRKPCLQLDFQFPNPFYIAVIVL